MWMTHFLQNSYFPINSINVTLIFDFILFKDLNGNFVSCNYMSTLFDFSKCSFTLSLANNKATNLLAFTVFFFLWTVLIVWIYSFFFQVLFSVFICSGSDIFLIKLNICIFGHSNFFNNFFIS